MQTEQFKLSTKRWQIIYYDLKRLTVSSGLRTRAYIPNWAMETDAIIQEPEEGSLR